MHQIRQKKPKPSNKPTESTTSDERPVQSTTTGAIAVRRATSDDRTARSHRSRRSLARCNRPTSSVIDDRDRAARRSTSGARPTSALVDCAARSTIASRDLIDRAARRRDAIVRRAARSGLSLLSLSL